MSSKGDEYVQARKQCFGQLRCKKTGSPMPCDNCPPDQDKRTAELLHNNYLLFMRRAYNTANFDYKAECVAQAKEAAARYKEIMGQEIPGSGE